MINPTEITEDLANKKLNVTRTFNAPIDQVWKAWTDDTLLDKWWAPRPWKAETKSMNFTEGGTWLYSMVGPEGERHWSRVDFTTITPTESFEATSRFCNEDGTPDSNMPTIHWVNVFKPFDAGTLYEATLSFDKAIDMETLVKMGFKGGFTMGLGNLDELLAK
ncbi:SRPBCC family protein [Mucilaginibacter antarcticus]|uniref:SRPBCC domain-containing protein n=2 Tax=Mucilaginibacter antarcticus TaxID=1855725 RepID=A0ABW5XLR1_9SPHI